MESPMKVDCIDEFQQKLIIKEFIDFFIILMKAHPGHPELYLTLSKKLED
jgi:hypothetical protein